MRRLRAVVRRRSIAGLAVIAFALFSGSLSGPAAATDKTKTTRPSGRNASLRSQREAIEKRLRVNDEPPSASELRTLGPHPEEATAAIADDPHTDVHIRARALAAMANLPSAATQAFLGHVIAAKTTSKNADDQILLRRAALALGWQGGPATPAALGPLLSHPQPDVRIDGALALGLTRLPSAATLLRTRMAEETDPRVRGQIGRQLRVIEAAIGVTAAPALPPLPLGGAGR